ncbi:MAG: hypothetical protein SF339_20065 [Blastocatellia bacterium]|nr:hypothetical protein [Blastocatellia bacterium]
MNKHKILGANTWLRAVKGAIDERSGQQMAEMLGAGKGDAYEFAETRRRLGFEYAGMRLHEYYFGALKPDGSAVDETLKAAVAGAWGS